VAVLLSLGASAQVPDRELEIAKALFDAGNYAEALKRVEVATEVVNGFSSAQRIELHRVAALSAFNLGKAPVASEHFLELLKLDPDYVLDPFAAPPPALKLFEQVKKDNADALNLIRQQLALTQEQERRAAAEREKKRQEELEKKALAEAAARAVTVRTVENHSLVGNFVPFGFGQYQQGRTVWAATFAVLEALTGLTSVSAYIYRASLFAPSTLSWSDRLVASLTGKFEPGVVGIPSSSKDAAATAHFTTNLFGAVFYLLWGIGVVDALAHHSPATVTETKEPLKTAPSITVQPIPGGAAAGLTVPF
jgi:tetratricopeptide (TPR) repeat protein